VILEKKYGAAAYADKKQELDEMEQNLLNRSQALKNLKDRGAKQKVLDEQKVLLLQDINLLANEYEKALAAE